MRSLSVLIITAHAVQPCFESTTTSFATELSIVPFADRSPGNLRNVGGIMDMISDLGNLWNKGEGAFDGLTCSKLPTTRDCCINKCAVCVGGPLMTLLENAGKLGDLFKRAGVSEQQLAAGEVCGLPKSYCDQFTKYTEGLPGPLVTALKYVGITVPHYYASGECPDRAIQNTLVSGSVMLISAILLLSIIN